MAAPEQRPDAGPGFRELEGLYQIVVGSQVQDPRVLVFHLEGSIRGRTALDPVHGISVLLEQARHSVAEQRVILDDKESQGKRSFRPGGNRAMGLRRAP